MPCWFQTFHAEYLSFEEEEGRGPLSSVDNNELKALIESEPQGTIRELEQKLNVRHLAILERLKHRENSEKRDKWDLTN